MSDADKLLALTRLYNAGYAAGHHDTVEGGYADVHPSDAETYHCETVSELLTESDFRALAQPAEAVDTGALTNLLSMLRDRESAALYGWPRWFDMCADELDSFLISTGSVQDSSAPQRFESEATTGPHSQTAAISGNCTGPTHDATQSACWSVAPQPCPSGGRGRAMAMVELRWVRSSKPTTDPDRLQYRAYLPLANGPYRHGDWGKWQDVPLVIVDEPTRDRRCPYCAGVIYTDAGCQNCKLGSAHNPSSGEMT